MTPDEARTVIAAALRHVAPEADLGSVPGDVELREELDIDSMDFLNLLIEVSAQTGIDIPEADYGRVSTLDRFVAYLVQAGG